MTEPLPPEAYARVFEGNQLPKEQYDGMWKR